MSPGNAQARKLPENQRIDAPKVREFTKIYTSPIETEEFDTSDDDRVNLVTTAPRHEHERKKQTNKRGKQKQTEVARPRFELYTSIELLRAVRAEV